MTQLPKHQKCPYCNYEVDDSSAEWDEDKHTVTCALCERVYSVTPIYEFKGFHIRKICKTCVEPEEECCCNL